MYVDRIKLNELNKKKKEITKEINTITSHKNGTSYGKMLSKLIYEVIRDNDLIGADYFNSVKRYKEYSRIHFMISSIVGVKTQVWTKSEYIEALSIIQREFNYNIKEYYMI